MGLDASASIYCPNCRTVLKSLNQIHADTNQKSQRFNFKFKRVHFKVFVNMDEHRTFSQYLSNLLEIEVNRLKIINRGRQCDDNMIAEFINNGSNESMQYMVIGSKQSVYTFGTRINTEYTQRV